MIVYLVTALALLLYFLIVWLMAAVLHLQGRDLWIFWVALTLIAISGTVVFLWFYTKVLKQRAAAGNGSATSQVQLNTEMEAIVREAEARLRSSKLGRSTRLKELPCVFLLGDSDTAKTSCMEHSGLDAELLGGHVYENNDIVPTPVTNLWYAKNTTFVEINTKAATGTALSRLLRHFQGGKIRVLKGESAARVAVVCFTCDAILQAKASEALAACVRRLRASLEEIARSFGSSFPIYVLFTKADRIPFFAEFAGILNSDETEQVLGVTLPMRSSQEKGVYAEQESQRLNTAFNNLIFSLADRRLDLLGREHDSQKLAGIYEFPRELRKLRAAVVQFLIDLCRPSELRAAPFLRGFYFSGVRAEIVNEVRPAAEPSPQLAAFNPQLDATRMFNAGQPSTRPDAVPQVKVVSSRRVPRWTFLSHFFSDVLLEDPLATHLTGSSTKTLMLRRVALAGGIASCLLLSLAFLISYFSNRTLETRLEAAAVEMASTPTNSGLVAAQRDLAQLDTLRQAVQTLSQYGREGAPLHLRWGLYVGGGLYPDARGLYFRRFNQLLFASAQAAILDSLKRLPSLPGSADDYGTAYDSLKAYLITTSNHDKSTSTFLTPVLLKRWTEGRNPDAETIALAQKQFDFYAEELKIANPFSSENDTSAVEHARGYLSQFTGAERVYRFMLAEASRTNPSIAFNKQFPGSNEALVDTKEIPGGYTKAGWTFMQNAIKNVDRFFSGEQWVLGDRAPQAIDRSKLDQELKDRYAADFIAQWQQFLRAATVLRYNNAKDGASKLGKLSSNQSPLLAVLCLVSQNTAVDSQQIKTAFQSVQFVAPPSCVERYISEANSGYMNALVGLDALIEQMANAPGGTDALVPQITSTAVQAKIVSRQVAQNFRIDPTTHLETTVQKLMEDPITYAESLVRNAGPAELNAKGKTLCGQFSALAAKYPFNSNAALEATLPEVNSVFQPQQGALWTFYEANLRAVTIRQGAQFAAKPDSPIPLNPAFVNFLNTAAAFTDAVYPDNSAQPHLVYSVRPNRMEGLENVALSIDGQTITTTGATAPPRQFVWSGNANSEVKLTGGPGLAYTGVWAAFKFFGDAERWSKDGSVYTLEWTLRLGRATPLTIRFDLDMGKAAPVFQKNFLSNLRCVAELAR